MAIHNSHAQELHFLTTCHLTLILINHQSELLFNEVADIRHNSFRRLWRPHEDITIISKPAKLQPSAFQLFIKLVKYHVTQQRA